MSDFKEQKINELSVELSTLGEDFSDLNSLFEGELFSFADDDPEAMEALNELDEVLEESGLETYSAGDNSKFSLLNALDEGVEPQSIEMQFFHNVIRNRVKKILRKIVKLVKKFRNLKPCIPLVVKAIKLYKAKKYAKALRASYKAYRCIKKRR